MDDMRVLLREAVDLVRERPCHRPECIAGELDDTSHRLCQQIRSFIVRAEEALDNE
jgi:hypothetical protein